MQFTLYYIEHHSDVEFWQTQPECKLLNIEADGWGEFEHRIPFTARDIAEAKQVLPLDGNSSGVYNVYDDNNNLLFTEENE